MTTRSARPGRCAVLSAVWKSRRKGLLARCVRRRGFEILEDRCLFTAGALDPTFDGDGILEFHIAEFHPGADVTLQSDGKILLTGTSYKGGTSQDILLVRLNPDGSLDTTFDRDGFVITVLGRWRDVGTSVAVQADGKILVAGYSDQGGEDFALLRYNSDGSLDPTFGSDGIVITDLGDTIEYGESVAIQSDGKILVGGSSSDGSANLFAVVRYNTDGTLDTSFDGDGIVTTDVGPSNDVAYSVALQTDGKILLAGDSVAGPIGARHVFALARYNADGSLDASFDGDGIVTTAVGTHDSVESMAVQSDGKILVAGSSSGFAVVRYNADGTLDTSFDGDGKVTTPIGSSAYGHCVAVQTDGRILVAGTSYSDSQSDGVVVRYNSDGSLDLTFDGDGMVITQTRTSREYMGSLALQSDGKILVTGFSDDPQGRSTSFLMRYLGNREPSGIAVDPSTVAENQPAGTLVGTLSTSDPDTDDTFVYALVPGPGADDNALFAIDGNRLETAASLDFETRDSYSIRVRSTDADGLWVEQVFAIRVTDANDAPVANGDTYRLAEGRALRVWPAARGVLANDLDQDGARLTAALVRGPSHGRVSLSRDGTFTYVPATGYAGTDQFAYVASDGRSQSAPGTVTLQIAGITPRVLGVQVNDGRVQRSIVAGLTVTFDREVTIDDGAFVVSRKGGGLPVGVSVRQSVVFGRTIAQLRFTGPGTAAGSLADGDYLLTIVADKVRRGGSSLDGDRNGTPGGDYVFGRRTADAFFRLFGDSDGDRDVDAADRLRFRRAYYGGVARYQWYFDSDRDGDLDVLDLLAFEQNYGRRLPRA